MSRKSKNTRQLRLDEFYFSYWYKNSDKAISKIAEQFGISASHLKAVIETGLVAKWYLTADYENTIFVIKREKLL